VELNAGHKLCEDDFYQFYNYARIQSELVPAAMIKDRRKLVRPETWQCAWEIHQSVEPIFKTLEHLFMCAEYPWEPTSKLPQIGWARKQLRQATKSFNAELVNSLMRELRLAVTREYALRKPDANDVEDQAKHRRRGGRQISERTEKSIGRVTKCTKRPKWDNSR